MKQKEPNVLPATQSPDLDAAVALSASEFNRGWAVIMRFCLAAFLVGPFLLCGNEALGTDWFVRPSSAGSGTGTDWNNAWSLGSLNWSSVKAGDIVWLAGGNYSETLSFGKSGTAAAPITVKRASASLPACTGAAGWSSSFDSLAVIPGTISCNGYSFITLDGSVEKGIQVPFGGSSPNGSNSGYGICFGAPNQSQVFTNLWLQGPGWGNVGNVKGMLTCTTKGLQLDKVISHCYFSGIIQPLDAELWYNCVVDHCTFIDVGGNTSSSYQHADIMYHWSGTNTTVRYCYSSNMTSQGFTFYWANNDNIKFYGNVFDVGTRSLAGGEIGQWTGSGGSYSGYWGNIYLWNNVFIRGNGFRKDSNTSSGGNGPDHMYVYNNLYLNATDSDQHGGVTRDYNGYINSSASGDGPNSIVNNTSPFVNANNDWHLAPGSWPINRGLAIATTNGVNIDPDGVARGAGGAWDLGAYEYGTTSTTNPILTVSTTSLNFGSVAAGSNVTATFSVQNSGNGTLAGSATVSAAYSSFLSIVSGGAYSLGAGQSQVVTVRYTPTGASTDSGVITCTGGGGAQINASGSLLAVLDGLTFPSYGGVISSPFTTNGGYL